MKRVSELEPLLNLSNDNVRIVLEIVITTSITSPTDLMSVHRINKNFAFKLNDRLYQENMFRDASKKSMELFKETKHGTHLSNYFRVLSFFKIFGIVNMIWREIIQPLDASLITEEEYHIKYRSNKGRELLNLGKLFGRKEAQGQMTKDERIMLCDVACLMKVKYGWILEIENDYQSVVYIQSI